MSFLDMSSALSMASPIAKGQIATTLFITLVHERRQDLQRYQFSLDRCYTNVDQANERAGLLSRCNTSPAGRDSVRQGRDHELGCCWISLTDNESSHVRYFVEVKCMWMLGNVNAVNAARLPMDLLPSTSQHDLAGHVFIVAVHEPEYAPSVAFDGKPSRMPWSTESIHSSCSSALARARSVWRESFFQQCGTALQSLVHYGLCRFALLPKYPYPKVDWLHRALYFTGVQLRVERVKVTLPSERIETFVPAGAIQHNRPFQPICPGREAKPLDRYLRELRAAQEPDDEEWEKDIAELELVDRLRKKRIEDSVSQRAPPPLRRALADVLADYTCAVTDIVNRPHTPTSLAPTTVGNQSQPRTPVLRALTGIRRSMSLRSSSTEHSTSNKLKRRSYYENASDRTSSQVDCGTTVEGPRLRPETAAVQFRRSMLTGSFTFNRC